ncbi:MAG: hypothetical protein ACRDAM_20915, partial [Casimicrobium sp.]
PNPPTSTTNPTAPTPITAKTNTPYSERLPVSTPTGSVPTSTETTSKPLSRATEPQRNNIVESRSNRAPIESTARAANAYPVLSHGAGIASSYRPDIVSSSNPGIQSVNTRGNSIVASAGETPNPQQHLSSDQLLRQVPRLAQRDFASVIEKLRELERSGWSIGYNPSKKTLTYDVNKEEKHISIGPGLTIGNIGLQRQYFGAALESTLREERTGIAQQNARAEMAKHIGPIERAIDRWEATGRMPTEGELDRASGWLRDLASAKQKITEVEGAIGLLEALCYQDTIRALSSKATAAYEDAANRYLDPAGVTEPSDYAQRALKVMSFFKQNGSNDFGFPISHHSFVKQLERGLRQHGLDLVIVDDAKVKAVQEEDYNGSLVP